jgi:hypothetical protein
MAAFDVLSHSVASLKAGELVLSPNRELFCSSVGL